MNKAITTLLLSSLMAVLTSTFASAGELPWHQGQGLIGEQKTLIAKQEYTFVDLGEEHNFGFNELVQANPKVDAWLPVAGDEIVLPGRFVLPDVEPEGIVINLSEYRLYQFLPKQKKVVTYPIGIGTVEFPTPLMETRVRMGLEKPTWYPPESIRRQRLKEFGEVLPPAIPAGPDNPLGPFALLLEANSYLIHGTNKAVGIGMRVSHGCIRLYNWDIEKLVASTPKQTPVRIIKQPVKLAVSDGLIWAEVHAEPDETPEQLRRHFMNALSGLELAPSYFDLEGSHIDRMLAENSGVPEVVGVVTQTPPSLAVAE